MAQYLKVNYLALVVTVLTTNEIVSKYLTTFTFKMFWFSLLTGA